MYSIIFRFYYDEEDDATEINIANTFFECVKQCTKNVELSQSNNLKRVIINDVPNLYECANIIHKIIAHCYDPMVDVEIMYN